MERGPGSLLSSGRRVGGDGFDRFRGCRKVRAADWAPGMIDLVDRRVQVLVSPAGRVRSPITERSRESRDGQNREKQERGIGGRADRGCASRSAEPKGMGSRTGCQAGKTRRALLARNEPGLGHLDSVRAGSVAPAAAGALRIVPSDPEEDRKQEKPGLNGRAHPVVGCLGAGFPGRERPAPLACRCVGHAVFRRIFGYVVARNQVRGRAPARMMTRSGTMRHVPSVWTRGKL